MSWWSEFKHKWWGPSHITVPSAEGRRAQVIKSTESFHRKAKEYRERIKEEER